MRQPGNAARSKRMLPQGLTTRIAWSVDSVAFLAMTGKPQITPSSASFSTSPLDMPRSVVSSHSLSSP